MKKLLLLPVLALPLLAGCAASLGAAGPQPAARERAPVAIPAVHVGKDWQVQERAPDLTDERGRVSFQTEQSVQPQGATPAAPPGQSVAPRQ